MYKTFGTLLAALVLTVSTAAFAQTALDASGRVVRIDPGAQLIILDNHQAFRVTPQTVLFVDNRPVPFGTLHPGQTVVIRAGEAVALQPSAPITAQVPSSTTVVTAPSASISSGLSQQTVYGQITDVETGKVKVKTPEDDFHVKVPPEVASQLRKGDTVRLDLTFRPTR
jgi:hypothetical protein